MLAWTYFINGLFMVVLPLVLGVWLSRRHGLSWGIFGLGASTFFVSQILHIPFNQFLLLPALGIENDPGVVIGVGAALALGLSAGVFEEGARYVAMRRMKAHERSLNAALMFGAGHGGLEAMILGVLVLYGLLQALALRGADLTQVVPPGELALTQARLQAYWSMSMGAALLGALERASAIMFHLLASVLVMTAVLRKRPAYLLLAIALHTLLDAGAVLILPIWGAYVTEAILFVFGLTCLYGIYLVRRSWPETVDPPPSQRVGIPRSPDPEKTPDKRRLDESRYL